MARARFGLVHDESSGIADHHDCENGDNIAVCQGGSLLLHHHISAHVHLINGLRALTPWLWSLAAILLAMARKRGLPFCMLAER